MTKREQALLEALKCLYVPYLWGGDSPDTGMDCSGFVGHVLRKAGLLPKDYDDTAQGYLNKYHRMAVATPTGGCVAFYGKGPAKITHVMLIVNSEACIGAIRGNKWIDSILKAKKRNARVDVRAIDYRKDLVLIVDPFQEEENGTDSVVR